MSRPGARLFLVAALAAATLAAPRLGAQEAASPCDVYAAALLAAERENMARRCPMTGPEFVAPHLLEAEGRLDWDEVADYYRSVCQVGGMTAEGVGFYEERHAALRRQGMATTPDCDSALPPEHAAPEVAGPPSAEAEIVGPPPPATLEPARTRSALIGFAESLESLSDEELEAAAVTIATRAVLAPDPAWEAMAGLVREEAARRDAASPRETMPSDPSDSPPPGAVEATTLAPAAWSGGWATSAGVNVTMELDGERLSGRYASVQGFPVGTIDDCTLEGRMLRGRWTNASRAPGATAGRFEWALESDGARFAGTWWSEDGTERGAWSGSRP